MLNLKDMFIKVERELYMKEADLILVLKCLDEVAREAKFYFLRKMNMEIGTCSEHMDGMKWYVECNLTEKQWHVFLGLLKDKKRKFVLGETGRYYLS